MMASEGLSLGRSPCTSNSCVQAILLIDIVGSVGGAQRMNPGDESNITVLNEHAMLDRIESATHWLLEEARAKDQT